MPSLPMGTSTFGPLHEMMLGQIGSRLLQAGLNLGVFDLLCEFQTARETAAEMGAHETNTRLFLDALANLGLLEKKDGCYRNSCLASDFLVSGSNLFLGSFLNMAKKMSLDPLDDLEALVREGPGQRNTCDCMVSEELWVQSAMASAPWAMGEMGSRAARLASKLPEFDRFEKMLDLGGGHGLFSLYITRASANLRAVVFDREPVTAVASEFINTYDMDHRVTVMAGDYTVDDLGSDYDLIWASATLGPSKGQLDDLLEKIHTALKPGGYFLSLHDGMTCEQTQPDMILEWLGGLLSSDGDPRFDQGELAEAMLRSGFSSVRSRTIDTPLGPMELDIARK